MANTEHLCTWLERKPESPEPSFYCLRLFQCLMSKGHHYTGISQGGRLVGITSFPENIPHGVTATWGQPTAPTLPGTEVPLKSNRSAGHKVTTPSCLIPDFSSGLLEGVSGRGQWGGHSNQARPCCEGSVTSLGLCRYRSRSIQCAQKCVYRYICNIFSGIALFSNSANIT